MTVNITVTRSAAWCNARAVATGESVSQWLSVTVNPADLTPEARAVLLKNGSLYPADFLGYFGKDRAFSDGGGGYGRIDLTIDSDSPTSDEICGILVAAAEKLAEKRAKYLEEQAEFSRQRAAAELVESQLRAARELLAPEFARLRKRVAELEAEAEDED
jgi:hypothetical protein